MHSIDDRHSEMCCGQQATNVFWSSPVMLKPDIDGRKDTRGGVWMEHLDSEPVWVESRAQLREECKKRQVSSKYLDG